MTNLFLTKIRFDKMLETGIIKTVTEQYIVDALSFTEAEARATQYITPFISGEFKIHDISRTNISEIFSDEGDKWYKIKSNFITIDVKTAVERKQATYYLVSADNIDNAKANYLKAMKGTLADFEVESISETKILDVIK